MANYGYLHLPRKLSEAKLETELREAVGRWFGDRMTVTRWDDIEDDGPVWFVCIPGSERTGVAASWALLADGQPVGFTVALQGRGRRIAFRHPLNMFESWAQGCIAEEMSGALKVGIHYDATDKTYKPGVRRYRCRRSFRLYLARNFPKPLSEEDEQWLARFKPITPEGWW